MHTYLKKRTARAVSLLPAPSVTRDLVAAFTAEILAQHDKIRDLTADNEDAYYSLRKESRIADMSHDYAREHGKSEDDERMPAAYLSGEVDAMRDALLSIAEHMGVPRDTALLTSKGTGKLRDAVLARWQRVERAATRHGWAGTDGLPEEHLDAEVSLWRARAVTAQDATMPRLRGHIGD